MTTAYDTVGNIMAFEGGELGDAETVELFVNLGNSGQVWGLQGSYQRTFRSLIESGHIIANQKTEKYESTFVILEPVEELAPAQIGLSEDQIIKALTNFITTCDADDLARITGDVFGGACVTVSEDNGADITYEFTPNEYYMNAFHEGAE